MELRESVLKLQTATGTILGLYEDDNLPEEDEEALFYYNNDKFAYLIREASKEFEEAHAKLLSSIEEIAKNM